jgi:hypothetical protein
MLTHATDAISAVNPHARKNPAERQGGDGMRRTGNDRETVI